LLFLGALLFCRSVIFPTRQFANCSNISFNRHLPNGHFIILAFLATVHCASKPFCHLVILPTRHFAKLLLNQLRIGAKLVERMEPIDFWPNDVEPIVLLAK